MRTANRGWSPSGIASFEPRTMSTWTPGALRCLLKMWFTTTKFTTSQAAHIAHTAQGSSRRTKRESQADSRSHLQVSCLGRAACLATGVRDDEVLRECGHSFIADQ
jgi:hypothetical protein